MGIPTNLLLTALPTFVPSLLGSCLKRGTLLAGHVLYNVHDPIRRVYFPIEAIGSLRIPLLNGHTVETAMVGRDGVLGALAAFGAKRSSCRAVVQISGDCLYTEVDALTSAVVKFPELRSLIISHEEVLLSHIHQSAACNATHHLESRLARRLLRAVDLRGSDELLLTQEYLAEMLGARRATVTLIAQNFQNAGMIKYTRGHIKICDTVKLQMAACECYRVIKSNYEALLPSPDILSALSLTDRLSLLNTSH